MRALLILIVGCLPLAALTVWSFVEMATAPSATELASMAADWQGEVALAARARVRVRAEAPLVRDLTENELLGGAPLPGLEQLPPEGHLESFGDAWRQWVRVRELATKVLLAEQSAQAKGLPELKEAHRQLDELLKKYGQSPPPGGQGLIEALGRRQAALAAAIAQREREIEAGTLFSRVQAAFDRQRWDECLDLAEQALTKYADALPPSARDETRLLCQRAQFRADAEAVEKSLAAATSDDRRMAVLRGFLDRHGSTQDRPEADRSLWQRYDEQLRRLQRQYETQESTRAAYQALDELARQPHGRVPERIARTLAVFERYPTEKVQARVRAELRQLLTQWLAEKPLAEHAKLQEMETKKGEIIRGFIKEVFGPGGVVIGFKRYPTYEQYLNPVAEVGTYRTQDLLRLPGPSIPRQSVERFNEARRRALERPERRDAWVQLAGLCQALDAQWREYRAKPGSSTDTLSFSAEEQSVQELLQAPIWPGLAKVFGS